MNDDAKFSMGQQPPYRVDGPFLAQLYNKLLDIALSVTDPEHVYGQVEIENRVGPHGVRKTRSHDTRYLLDGSNPFPDSVTVCVGGHVFNEHGHRTFHLSAQFDPLRGDHLYASGPTDIAHPAFETIRAAAATRHLPPEEVPVAAKAPMRRSSVLQGSMITAMVSTIPAIVFAPYVGMWPLLIPVGLILFSLVSLYMQRPSAIIAIENAAPPLRVIDLSAPAGDAARLEYDPPVTIDL